MRRDIWRQAPAVKPLAQHPRGEKVLAIQWVSGEKIFYCQVAEWEFDLENNGVAQLTSQHGFDPRAMDGEHCVH
jgi:hypothetical protein